MTTITPEELPQVLQEVIRQITDDGKAVIQVVAADVMDTFRDSLVSDDLVDSLGLILTDTGADMESFSYVLEPGGVNNGRLQAAIDDHVGAILTDIVVK